MREIILDTETTGLSPANGDKIVEIGCVELINHLPTGNCFQKFLNPERDIPEEAIRIHGLTREFLKDKPVFSEIAEDFLEFIGDDTLIIHNADFDIKFLNAELAKAGFKPILMNRVIDTLALARKKFPGVPTSLDALCRRFNIDNSDRSLHGALLDSKLLAAVYLELIGGRQTGLELGQKLNEGPNIQTKVNGDKNFHPPRPHAPSQEELEAHTAFIRNFKNPLWLQD